MTDTDKDFNTRIKQTKSRLLDVADSIIERLAERQLAPPSPPIAVARRIFANTLRLWKFCDKSRCRRSQCCRGEPLHCLSIGLTLLPKDTFGNLMENGKSRARKERRCRA